ncbi:MAG: hypothetical protein GY811_04055 [Myxococcales bacterium]|nr:hypothetical protein [Myxococcales bacterium]
MSFKAVYSVHIAGKPESTNEDGLTYTKQSVLAFPGPIRVIDPGDDFFGNGAAFRDRVIEIATWRAILGAASRQIRKTKDFHHQYLEDAEAVGSEVDRKGRVITLVRLVLGS